MSGGRPSLTARTGPRILLAVEDEGWHAAFGDRLEALVREAVFAAAERAGLPPAIDAELGVTLADDAEVKGLNAEWRGKDRPTNILSFPMRQLRPGEAPGPLIGDLVLAREILEREAAAEGKRPADHFRHLLVHGFLHCLGHDHGSEPDAERMERLEILVLADLGIADPYDEAGAPAPGADPS